MRTILNCKRVMTDRQLQKVMRLHRRRLTPQRAAVLAYLAKSPGHRSAAEVLQGVRATCPGISQATVYRTLEMLEELGLACCMEHDGRQSYLKRRSEQPHHHHLICIGCRRVIDFTDCRLAELEERLQRETGFATEGHRLELYGRCPDCQAQSGATAC